MPKQTFVLNGKTVTVDVHDDVRVLWVLRDLLGVTGPKYGCGINVCKACTSHINGKAFNPCSVRVGDLKADDEVTTIEGLPKEWKKQRREERGDRDQDDRRRKGALHPMQQAWLDHDVAQCGYCQPGQIMAAVALVNKVRREGRKIREKDLDAIRNICRCGTYTRIREAIEQGARQMR
jgi:isoquinoline 1-oxidoreductase alpha subunit